MEQFLCPFRRENYCPYNYYLDKNINGSLEQTLSVPPLKETNSPRKPSVLRNAILPSDRLPIKPGDVTLPVDYKIRPVATGLNFPTSVTFDNMGIIYIGESGYSYGPAKADGQGRILRLERSGT